MPTPKQAMMMGQPSETAICARAATRSLGVAATASIAAASGSLTGTRRSRLPTGERGASDSA